MRQKAAFFVLLWTLIGVIPIFAQDKGEIIQETKPYYNWAGGIELGYFTPVDYYKELINPGYYLNFKARMNPKLWDYFLCDFEGGLIFSNFKNNPDVGYYFMPFSVSGIYQYPLFSNLFLDLKLGAGFYYLKIQGEGFGNLLARAGLGFSHDLSYNLQLSLREEFFWIYDSKKPLYSLATFIAFQYAFGEPLTQKDVQVVSLEYEKLFAAHYPVYYKENIGMVRIKNIAGEDLKNIKVSIMIQDYLEDKTVSKIQPPNFGKNETLTLPLYVFFPHKIKGLIADQETTAVLEIEYEKTDKRKYKKRELLKIKIYNKNALVWDNLAKLGSFSSVKDQTVIDFTRKILAAPIKIDAQGLDKDFVNLVKIMEGLKMFALEYIKDPNTPYENFSRQKAAADYIQYPRETLLKKTGDCDDLTVLIASMLEGAGLATAYLTVPGHIFLLVEIKTAQNSSGLVELNGKKWLPLESTLVSQGFMAAWRQGLKNFQESAQAEKEVKILGEAVQKYPPIIFDEKLEIPFTFTEMGEGFGAELKKALQFLSIPKKEGETLSEMSARELTQKGLEYSKTGQWEKAEAYYKKAIEKEPSYKTSYYNLVILYRIKKEYPKSFEIFKQFSIIFKNDSQMNDLMREVEEEMAEKKAANGLLTR